MLLLFLLELCYNGIQVAIIPVGTERGVSNNIVSNARAVASIDEEVASVFDWYAALLEEGFSGCQATFELLIA